MIYLLYKLTACNIFVRELEFYIIRVLSNLMSRYHSMDSYKFSIKSQYFADCYLLIKKAMRFHAHIMA